MLLAIVLTAITWRPSPEDIEAIYVVSLRPFDVRRKVFINMVMVVACNMARKRGPRVPRGVTLRINTKNHIFISCLSPLNKMS